jgi:hypothetical protein
MWLSTLAWAACDPTKVDALVTKLRTASDPLVAAAADWGPLCAGDGVLDAQMAQIATARPENRWLVELQTSVLDPRSWWVACGTKTSAESGLALSMATKMNPEARRAEVWGKCDLDRFGAFSQAEWSSTPGMLVLPILAASALKDGGIPADHARPIVRALAGL